jgi:hypothetical protein
MQGNDEIDLMNIHCEDVKWNEVIQNGLCGELTQWQ